MNLYIIDEHELQANVLAIGALWGEMETPQELGNRMTALLKQKRQHPPSLLLMHSREFHHQCWTRQPGLTSRRRMISRRERVCSEPPMKVVVGNWNSLSRSASRRS